MNGLAQLDDAAILPMRVSNCSWILASVATSICQLGRHQSLWKLALDFSYFPVVRYDTDKNFLKQRQYKNDSTESRCMLILKLPPFFPHRIAEGKRAAISKQTIIWTPSSGSYTILALVLLLQSWHNRFFSRFQVSGVFKYSENILMSKLRS